MTRSKLSIEELEAMPLEEIHAELRPYIEHYREAIARCFAQEEHLIRDLEAGAVIEEGKLTARVVSGYPHGKLRKRVVIIDKESGQPLTLLEKLFDGGVVQ